MKLSIEEFRCIMNMCNKAPIQLESKNSITLHVDVDKQDKLKHPIQVSDQTIEELGIYRSEGIAIWVVKS